MEQYNDIQQQADQIRRNIADSFTDQLNKSHITDSFLHSSNELKIYKSGQQIKDSLTQTKQKYTASKQLCLEQMEQLLKQCGQQPTEEIDKYMLSPYEDKFSMLPKTFSWKVCDSISEKQSVSELTITDQSQPNQDAAQCCRKYNDCVRKYITTCKDCFVIDTMINGLQDKRQYELTIRQAAALGL